MHILAVNFRKNRKLVLNLKKGMKKINSIEVET